MAPLFLPNFLEVLADSRNTMCILRCSSYSHLEFIRHSITTGKDDEKVTELYLNKHDATESYISLLRLKWQHSKEAQNSLFMLARNKGNPTEKQELKRQREKELCQL